jgi:RND superfamily putative drug exporter
LERWTRLMIRYRWPVLGVWLVVLFAGYAASTGLPALLSNTFTMPGTDSERARTILRDHYGDRSDGAFTVVFRVANATDPAVATRLQRELAGAAREVPTGRALPLARGGQHVLYADIVSTLSIADAKGYTDDVLRALPQGAGVRSYVTGQAAIQHDLDPIFDQDLQKGEFRIALPIALLVLLLVFGLSWSATIPLVFAACTIMGTLGVVYLFAHELTMATYVTNLVQLIGLGIAIDYSLLIVYRFREELARNGSTDAAIVRTMTTAGRAVVFSGATVAIGLALLLFMPSPFMRSMGIGGFMIPLVSIACAVTLQPALLSL